MKTPKIVFDFSTAYNRLQKEWMKTYGKKIFKKYDRKFSSTKELLAFSKEYIQRIEKSWKKYENKILQEISKICGLKWKEEYIKCYIVYIGLTMSDPLTMHTFRNDSDFIDFLTHELIHIILEDNRKRTRDVWNYFERKYENENEKTRLHIPILAIHAHIFEKFFDKERMEKHINMLNYSPFYARAWQIVQRDGYENIIREFRKRIR